MLKLGNCHWLTAKITPCLVLVLAGHAGAQSFEGGYKALQQKNYTSAQETFTKLQNKRSTASHYGFALLCAAKDPANKAYNLDSSYYHINVAEKEFAIAETEDRQKLQGQGVSFDKILTTQKEIVQQAFDEAKQTNTVAAYDHFISFYPKSANVPAAIQLRNQLAFSIAKGLATPRAYKAFMDNYPNAAELRDARIGYQTALFDSTNQLGKPADYQLFIDQHSDNPFIARAEDSIYTKVIRPHTADAYLALINGFPKNHNLPKAWKQLFQLYTYDLMPASYEAFLQKYPQYPERSQVRREMEQVNRPLYAAYNGNNWGFINSLGAAVILFNFTEARDFSENYAATQYKDKWVYVGKTGSIVLETPYSWLGDFKAGLAPVMQGGKYGLINKKGELVVPLRYDTIATLLGPARLMREGGQYGLLRANGTQLAAADYDAIYPYQHGMARVLKKGLYGFLDEGGNLIIPAEYEQASDFTGGVAVLKKGGKYGVMNTDQKWVAPLEYDLIGTPSEGKVWVAKGKVAGYLKLDGKPLAPLSANYLPQDTTFRFHRGLAPFRQGAKLGLLDTLGKVHTPATYDRILLSETKFISAKQNGTWGMLTLHTHAFKPIVADSLAPWSYGHAAVRKEEGWGYLDSTHKEVVPPQYAKALPFGAEGFAEVRKGDVWGLVSNKGEEVLPAEADKIEHLEPQLYRLTKQGRTAFFATSPGKPHVLWKSPGY